MTSDSTQMNLNNIASTLDTDALIELMSREDIDPVRGAELIGKAEEMMEEMKSRMNAIRAAAESLELRLENKNRVDMLVHLPAGLSPATEIVTDDRSIPLDTIQVENKMGDEKCPIASNEKIAKEDVEEQGTSIKSAAKIATPESLDDETIRHHVMKLPYFNQERKASVTSVENAMPDLEEDTEMPVLEKIEECEPVDDDSEFSPMETLEPMETEIGSEQSKSHNDDGNEPSEERPHLDLLSLQSTSKSTEDTVENVFSNGSEQKKEVETSVTPVEHVFAVAAPSKGELLETSESATVVPPKKKRGRKPKSEMAKMAEKLEREKKKRELSDDEQDQPSSSDKWLRRSTRERKPLESTYKESDSEESSDDEQKLAKIPEMSIPDGGPLDSDSEERSVLVMLDNPSDYEKHKEEDKPDQRLFDDIKKDKSDEEKEDKARQQILEQTYSAIPTEENLKYKDLLQDLDSRYNNTPASYLSTVVREIRMEAEKSNNIYWLQRVAVDKFSYNPFDAPMLAKHFIRMSDKLIYGKDYDILFKTEISPRKLQQIEKYCKQRRLFLSFGRFPKNEIADIRELCSKHKWNEADGKVVFANGRTVKAASKKDIKPTRSKLMRRQNYKMFQPGDLVWVQFGKSYWPAFIISLEVQDKFNKEHPKPRTQFSCNETEPFTEVPELILQVRYETGERTFTRIDRVDFFHVGFAVRYDQYSEDESYVSSVAATILKCGERGYFEEFMNVTLYEILLKEKWEFSYLPLFTELKMTKKNFGEKFPNPIHLYEARELYRLSIQHIPAQYVYRPFEFDDDDRCKKELTIKENVFMDNVDLRHFAHFVSNNNDDVKYPTIFNPTSLIMNVLEAETASYSIVKRRSSIHETPVQPDSCCRVVEQTVHEFPHWQFLACTDVPPPTKILQLESDEYPPNLARKKNSLTATELEQCYQYAREKRAAFHLHKYFAAKRIDPHVPEPHASVVNENPTDSNVDTPKPEKKRAYKKRNQN